MNNRVNRLPLIALRGMTILPYMVIHFDVSRKKSIKAVDTAMKNGQTIFLATQKSADIMEPSMGDVYDYGTVSEIKQIVRMPGGLVRVLVRGLYRGKLLSLETENDMFVGDIEYPEEKEDKEDKDSAMNIARAEILLETVKTYYDATGRNQGENYNRLKLTKDFEELIFRCTAECTDDYKTRQDILSMDDITDKFYRIMEIIGGEVELFNIKKQLAAELRDRVDRHQKEYFLNEQLKLIKEELGTDEENEEEKFRGRLEKLDAPEYVKEKLTKEIKIFSGISSHSSEYHVERMYIETLLEMPWNTYTEENTDVLHAEKVLNDDHYGLTKVKERILEFIAVRALKSDCDAPILCLVGPPGTGKTSIATSVAKALNRKYVRICLGGVRDEAEIRGHRKTYVGAMPGRIVEGLKQAKVSNPLMLLDEIDKVGTDSRGDTASALLEILDSAQNNAFRDHYVEIPVDLSKCLFIATANDTQTIPKPLLDRMEIVEVNSYTQVEKIHIAKEHLVAKQIKKNGLTSKQISFSKDAINKIIENYTREAGVRELERRIAAVCRKAARLIMSGNDAVHKIKASNLADYLGVVKYDREEGFKKDSVGIVKGLAWTAVGGTTLDVEACIMDGKGEVTITGQLGDVMKESAMVALGYIRSKADYYGIDSSVFEKKNIHIHVPEGAVPKDGPSAGITMTLAMISAYTGRKVRHDVAMTGEITLHGQVLPIGGLKEKMLAAKNVGVKTILVPDKNEKDVLDMEAEITDGIRIVYVKKMEEVVKEALC